MFARLQRTQHLLQTCQASFQASFRGIALTRCPRAAPIPSRVCANTRDRHCHTHFMARPSRWRSIALHASNGGLGGSSTSRTAATSSGAMHRRRVDRGPVEPLEESVRQAVHEILQRGSTGPVVCTTLEGLAQTFRLFGRKRSGLQQHHVEVLCDLVEAGVAEYQTADLCRIVKALERLSIGSRLFHKYIKGDGMELLHAISGRIVEPEVLQGLSGRQAANMLHSFSKMQVRNEALVQGIGQQMLRPQIMHSLSGQDVSLTLWALAKVGIPHPELSAALGAFVVAGDIADSLSAQSLANIAWAFARLHVKDAALMALVASQMLRRMSDANAQDISNTVWAFATLDIDNPDLMAAVASRMLQEGALAEFNAQNLANTLWGFATLGVCNLRLMNAVADWILEEGTLVLLKPQEIANMVWAYATLGVNNPLLMAAVADWLSMDGATLFEFKPQEIGNVLWAFATLGVDNADLMVVVMRHITQEGRLAEFHAQEVANTVWAFSKLAVFDSHLLNDVATWVLQDGRLALFKPQEISNMLWAFATADSHKPDLMAAVAALLLQEGALSKFKPQEIANTVWAFATLRIRNSNLMATIARHVLQGCVLAEFNSQDIANTVWAFAILGIHDTELTAALASRVLQEGVLADFKPHEITITSWGLAVSGCLHDSAILQLLVAAEAMDSKSMLSGACLIQLHQVLLHVRLHEQEFIRSAKALSELSKFADRCAEHFATAPQNPSQLQRSVAAVIRELGMECKEEVVLVDAGGYSVDVLVEDPRVAVEVDGPSHYVQDPQGLVPSGSTMLKRQQLKALGYHVVSVPFWEWRGLRSALDKRVYVQQLMGLAQQ